MSDIDDAEWIDVDQEFGPPDKKPVPRPSTQRPSTQRPPPPRRTSRPIPPPSPAYPHDAPELAPSPGSSDAGLSSALVGGLVGGILGVALIVLLVSLFVMRRKLNKARLTRSDSQYGLRVEDIAHMAHLNATNTSYTNTADLQRLVSSIAGKPVEQRGPPGGTSSDALPAGEQRVAPPFMVPPGGGSRMLGNKGRPPMPNPKPKATVPSDTGTSMSTGTLDSLYVNLNDHVLAPPTTMTARPPVLPSKSQGMGVGVKRPIQTPASPNAVPLKHVVARPAPPLPKQPLRHKQDTKPQCLESYVNTSKPPVLKPVGPPVAAKPFVSTKAGFSNPQQEPEVLPTPQKTPKPSPLKVALLPPVRQLVNTAEVVL